MQITSQVYESPARAVISYKWQSVQTVEAKKDTVVRYQGGIKSPILSEVKEGDSLQLLEEMENWSKVATSDGFLGYVENKRLENLAV